MIWIPDLFWLLMPICRNKEAYLRSTVSDRFLRTLGTITRE